MRLRILGLFLLSLIFSSFYFLDTKLGKKSPEEVTKAFYEALRNKDFESAKQYATPKTQLFLDAMHRLTELPHADDLEEIPTMEHITCTSQHKRVERCELCCDETGETSNEALYLVKIKGKWKIHMTKETSQGGAEVEDFKAFIASAEVSPKVPQVKLGEVANTPEAVAMAFSKCLAAGAFEQAQAFTSAESKESIAMLNSLVLLIPEEELQSSFPGPAGIETVACSEDGENTFRCQVCCTEAQFTNEELLLVQEEDNWKVEFNKEGTPGGPPEMSPNTGPPPAERED